MECLIMENPAINGEKFEKLIKDFEENRITERQLLKMLGINEHAITRGTSLEMLLYGWENDGGKELQKKNFVQLLRNHLGEEEEVKVKPHMKSEKIRSIEDLKKKVALAIKEGRMEEALNMKDAIIKILEEENGELWRKVIHYENV